MPWGHRQTVKPCMEHMYLDVWFGRVQFPTGFNTFPSFSFLSWVVNGVLLSIDAWVQCYNAAMHVFVQKQTMMKSFCCLCTHCQSIGLFLQRLLFTLASSMQWLLHYYRAQKGCCACCKGFAIMFAMQNKIWNASTHRETHKMVHGHCCCCCCSVSLQSSMAITVLNKC